MPWSLKIFYGLISDNCPLFGSRRRSYLILLSVLQVVATLTLAAYFGTNERYVAFLLMLMNLSAAAMDVIADSIMVIQSRRFPEDGSEQLQSFSWNCLALGGIIASLAGGFLTQNFHPNYSFLAAAVPSVSLLILSYSLPPSIERVEEDSDEAPKGFYIELKQNIGEII
jgi:MFS family permease